MSLLKSKNILITAGSTRGYIDAVRYITNTSTGKLGVEIALEAMRNGATVTYVYGKDSLFPVIEKHHGIRHSQLKLIEIETNNDLTEILQERLRNKKFDVVIHAMAVADYVPTRTNPNKTPSVKKELIVKLTKTPKVINIIRDMWPKALLVGFKLEVDKTKEELIKIAKRFLKKTKADLVIANDQKNISKKLHTAYLVTDIGDKQAMLKNKKEIAKAIINYLGKV